LFFQLSQSRFEQEVRDLRNAIPSLTDAEIVVGMMRITALVGDAHTTVDTSAWPGFSQLPLRFDWFSDGLYVVAASEEHRNALGTRLLRLGNSPVQAAVDALAEVIPHENQAWLMAQLPAFLSVPEILQSRLVVPNASLVTLELQTRSGNVFPIEAASQPRGTVQLIEAGTEELPLYRQRPEDNYWFTFVEEPRVLYLLYRRASDMASEPVTRFSQRFFDFLDSNPVQAIVIDLRDNGGGNSSLLEPFLVGLEQRPQWSGGDGLYTIIGRSTFSSALINAIELQSRTRAILVGEPTGGKPNHFGEVRSFNLPNSRLRVTYSTRFFRLLPDRDPPSLEPDIGVELSSEDYLSGRDPVLQMIVSFTEA
jgi:hypothetical protein